MALRTDLTDSTFQETLHADQHNEANTAILTLQAGGTTGGAGPTGVTWAGAWNAGTTYVPGDAVQYNGSSYVTENATTAPPPGSPWELMAEIGAVGPAGPTGPQGVVGPTGPMGPQGVGGSVVTADYIITFSAGNVNVMDGNTGNVDFSSTDAGAALSYCIAQLGSNGGTVTFRAGVYTWLTVPKLPPNLNNWLVITGNKNAYINLTASAVRFLDFGKLANGDIFRYLYIDGFTIDASGAPPAAGSHNHLVCGTYANGSTSSGWDVSFDHVVIRRIRTVGGATNLNATVTEQLNIFIQVYQDTPNLTPNMTLTNILVEYCDFYGGNQGVIIQGSRSSSAFVGECNIWIDNIVIHDIKHDVGSDPPQFSYYAHVQVGSHAYGGTVWIYNIWGRGSQDVGIEVDNMLDAHIFNVYMRNVHGYVLALTNFNAPPNWQKQAYYINNVTFVRDAGTFSTSSSGMIGLLASNNYSSTQQPFGRVFARDLKMFADGTNLPDIMTNQIQGEILDLTHSPLELMIDGATYYSQNYQQTNTGTASSPNVFYTRYNSGGGGQITKLTLRNIDMVFQATNAAGAAPMNATGMYLSGGHDFLVENASINLAITNPGTFVQMGMKIGHDTGSVMKGTIRNLRMMGNTDTNGRGIAVYDSSTLTIPGQIAAWDCDFAGMTGGQEYYNVATGPNQTKFFTYNTKWMTFPKAPVPITYSTSAVAQQWLGGYPGWLTVAGSAVNKTEISPDNTNWYTVSTANAAVVGLQHTYWYRITFPSGGCVVNMLPAI